MAVRTITTANRTVTLGQYIRAIKVAKAHPDAEFNEGLTCWNPCSGREIMQQFMHGVHDRINQGISYADQGMKNG